MHCSDLDALPSESMSCAAVETVAQVKALVDSGPLADATQALRRALESFPESGELRSLEVEIANKETAVHTLVEKAEVYLRDRDLNAAGEFFAGACSLLPRDRELADHIVAILYRHAQGVLENDWHSAQLALDLASRIQPHCLISPALIAVLHARAPRPKKKSAMGPRIAISAWVVACAALATLSVVAWKNYRHPLPPKNKPPIEISGIAPVETPALSNPVKAPPAAKQVPSVPPHRHPSGPASTVAVPAAEETPVAVQPDAKPATLTIRGVAFDTQVKVDDVPVGTVGSGHSLTGQLSPGAHVVALSRDGYLTKSITVQISSGESAVLDGTKVELESTDASRRAVPAPPPESPSPASPAPSVPEPISDSDRQAATLEAQRIDAIARKRAAAEQALANSVAAGKSAKP